VKQTAKVVPIRDRPRRTRRGTTRDEEALQRRVAELEREVAAAQRARDREGLFVTLARLAEAGARGVGWASLARLQRAVYFAWHSEETDDFGADRRFAESLEPLLDFLYAVWWRVETSGIEHVPDEGRALVVANHSGVLPYDGLMVQLAVRHEHPARRVCRMLALDMFALLPGLAPILARSGSVRANPANAERLLRRYTPWSPRRTGWGVPSACPTFRSRRRSRCSARSA
jgi:hypothetical protein